jgi:hypothetical protein
MKTIKIFLPLFFVLLTTFAVRATVLFNDATNYPYTDGPIEGQGQWYSYDPLTKPKDNVYVTNNVLLLVTASTNDSVATPTNGWNNSNPITYASFQINVTQLPGTPNGNYFCQLQNNNDTNDCTHIFIDTLATTVPGTYQLGVANFSSSFTSQQPPVNYPQDLATNTWYTVVVEFGNAAESDELYQGANLFINPSEDDYLNFLTGANANDTGGYGYVFATDTTSSTNLEFINITQIGFSPYTTAGISNVIAGTAFDDVNSTNLPVFGIQPQPGTNYTGNPATFYAVASGVDVTYQWYSTTFGQLSDGAAYTGSASDALTVNSLSASDTYYCQVTDAYGNVLDSDSATETVITTPTAPFFPTNEVNITNTANLFATSGFTNLALGTGPLYYQWYFAPTNTPNTFSPLSGQTSPQLSLYLADLTFQGNYYVVVSNSLNGGSIALGPTNTLVELAPLVATMLQLHNLEISFTNQIAANPGGVIVVSSNNVTVSGYVCQFNGFGSSSYSEYYIEDASGLGCEVYCGLPSAGTVGFSASPGNTNTPPVGTYLTVSCPLIVYEGALELTPTSFAAFTTNAGPQGVIAPRLGNSLFYNLVTNSLGSNALLFGDSMLTFTNCYIYGSKTGAAIGSGGTHSGVGGIFTSNTYTEVFFTINSPFNSATGHTNVMEIFQPCYNYGTGVNLKPSPLAYQSIQTNYAQLTGVYSLFDGTPELEPSRLADYVSNAPAPFSASISITQKGVTTVGWQPQVGSTYSVNGSTDLTGPWTQEAYGLAYYPTNGGFTETNHAPYKFYQITSP